MFSKYVITCALKDKRAQGVVDALLDRLLYVHGSPNVVLSDNGKEFKNDIKDAVANAFQFEQRFTAPYNPQGNGLCERCNGVIATLLGKMGLKACLGMETELLDSAVKEEVAKWDINLAPATYYYNTKVRPNSPTLRPYPSTHGP